MSNGKGVGRNENLIPISSRTKEERAEMGRKGGIASGIAKRERKSMQESLEILLGLPLKRGKCYGVDGIRAFADLKGKNISVQEAILIQQIQRALHGDLPSAEFLRDTSGQKPVDNMDINGNIPIVISGENELTD